MRDGQLRWVRAHRSRTGWASARARSKANPFVCRSDVSSLWEPACRRQAPVALPCVVGCLMGCNRCHGSSHIGRSAPRARPAAPMGAAESVAHRVGSCTSAIEGESVRSLQRCFLAVGAGMPATGACQLARSSSGVRWAPVAAMAAPTPAGAHRVRDRQLRWVRPNRSPTGWAPARARSKANPFVCRSDVSSLWESACRRQAPVSLRKVLGCSMGSSRCHGRPRGGLLRQRDRC